MIPSSAFLLSTSSSTTLPRARGPIPAATWWDGGIYLPAGISASGDDGNTADLEDWKPTLAFLDNGALWKSCIPRTLHLDCRCCRLSIVGAGLELIGAFSAKLSCAALLSEPFNCRPIT